jgi:hypothetical protein
MAGGVPSGWSLMAMPAALIAACVLVDTVLLLVR